MIFHEMQENNDEYKASKPQLLIISLVRIVRKELIDISSD